jgi:hypothetical protein
MIRIAACLSLLAALLAVGSPPSRAADMMTGSEIKTMVAGNTVTGAMVESGNYAEFYQADGIIKGNGYTGLWTVSADSMCFRYGNDPEKCLQVGKIGDQIQWFKGHRVDGTGMLVLGNPNNY